MTDMLPGVELYISTNRMILRCLKRHHARVPGSTYQCPTKYKYQYLHRCYSRGIFARATDSYTPVDHLSTCHLFPARQDAPSQVGVVLLSFDWRKKSTAIIRDPRGLLKEFTRMCAVRARVGKQIHGSRTHQRTGQDSAQPCGNDLARQQF
jgi:hypothetical protein